MIELSLAISALSVAMVVASVLLGQRMLQHVERQSQAHAEHLRAQAETHTSQVAALVEVIKEPPTPSYLQALAPEPEETLEEVDKQFAESGAGAVQWDRELAALPGIDD